MAAESGRLLAGQGKRSKGRNWFSPILPIRFGVIHYCAAMGCNGAVSKILSRPLPYVNFTTVSGGGCFPTESICERGSMSLLLSVYISPTPVFHVLMSSSPPVSLIDLTSLPVLRPLSPFRLGHFGLPGSFFLPPSPPSRGFIILVMTPPGCSASCPHARLCPHHWIHPNCWTWERGPRSKAALLCH